jgi:hypothetical protein
VLQLARRVAAAVELGYIGVDIVIDAHEGPMLLEANARPGLAIQTANARGLVRPLKEIDAGHRLPPPPEAEPQAIPEPTNEKIAA